MAEEKSAVEVGCAVIIKEGKVLIAQRKPGDSYGGYWEFPGGKKEPGETMPDCLKREIREELEIEIEPRSFLKEMVYDYPDRRVILFFYLCVLISGVPVKKDCHDFCWIFPEEFIQFHFLPGDADILRELMLRKQYYFGNQRIVSNP